MKKLLALLFALFVLITGFLTREMLRKFTFWDRFTSGSNLVVTWDYPGGDNAQAGMRNIVLRGEKPFRALVGFRLNLPLGYTGYDVFGYVESDAAGVAVFSAYLGHGSAEFIFVSSQNTADNSLVVSSTAADQQLSPTATYPPHWWQRLGFYG